MAREIPLTRGLVAIVDDEDFDWLNQWKWQARPRKVLVDGTEIFTVSGGFMTPRGQRLRFMHNLILEPPTGFLADHINRNPLDNRRSNLRLATRGQNAANRVMPRRAETVPFRGVVRSHKRFVAIIGVNGGRIRLGWYDDAEDAARAYDAKAREVHGEFAVLNFPDEAA